MEMSTNKKADTMHEGSINNKTTSSMRYSNSHFEHFANTMPNLFSPSFAPLQMQPVLHTLHSSESRAETVREREHTFTMEDRMLLRLVYQQQQLIYAQLGTLAMEMQIVTNKVLAMQNDLQSSRGEPREQQTTNNGVVKHAKRNQWSKHANKSAKNRSQEEHSRKEYYKENETALTNGNKSEEQTSSKTNQQQKEANSYYERANKEHKNVNLTLQNCQSVRSEHEKRTGLLDSSRIVNHKNKRGNANQSNILSENLHSSNKNDEHKEYAHNNYMQEDQSTNADIDHTLTSHYSLSYELRSCTPPHERDEASYSQSALNNSVESYSSIWNPTQRVIKQSNSISGAAAAAAAAAATHSSHVSVLGRHDNPLLSSQFSKNSRSDSHKLNLNSSLLSTHESYMLQPETSMLGTVNVTATNQHYEHPHLHQQIGHTSRHYNSATNQKSDAISVESHPSTTNKLKKPVLTTHQPRVSAPDRQERPIPPYQRVYEQTHQHNEHEKLQKREEEQEEEVSKHLSRRYDSSRNDNNNNKNTHKNKKSEKAVEHKNSDKHVNETDFMLINNTYNNKRSAHVERYPSATSRMNDGDMLHGDNGTPTKLIMNDNYLNGGSNKGNHHNVDIISDNNILHNNSKRELVESEKIEITNERHGIAAPSSHAYHQSHIKVNKVSNVQNDKNEVGNSGTIENRRAMMSNIDTLSQKEPSSGNKHVLYRQEEQQQQEQRKEHKTQSQKQLTTSFVHNSDQISRITHLSNNVVRSSNVVDNANISIGAVNIDENYADDADSVSEEDLSDGYGSYESREYLKQAGLLRYTESRDKEFYNRY